MFSCNPDLFLCHISSEHLLRFVDLKMTQEHVSRRSTEKYGTITGTVFFTDSTVYSESIGCNMTTTSYLNYFEKLCFSEFQLLVLTP